jgi:hypothetical protein
MLDQRGKNAPSCEMKNVAGPYGLREPKQSQPGAAIGPVPIEILTNLNTPKSNHVSLAKELDFRSYFEDE